MTTSHEPGSPTIIAPQVLLGRGGSVCLNRFSDLISGIPALVMKVMDPRSGTA